MTKITPAYVREIPRGFSRQAPILAVHSNCVRFNKNAAHLLSLPRKVILDETDEKIWLVLTGSSDGFDVKLSGFDFVINDRKLVNYLRSFFSTNKALLFIIQPTLDKDYFSLEKIEPS